jgi:hypothetical protein
LKKLPPWPPEAKLILSQAVHQECPYCFFQRFKVEPLGDLPGKHKVCPYDCAKISIGRRGEPRVHPNNSVKLELLFFNVIICTSNYFVLY